MATRQVFQALFGRGYRVVDFLKTEPGGPANYYVLARTAPSDP
jgi:predicted GNAT superfamily acetyltransferase